MRPMTSAGPCIPRLRVKRRAVVTAAIALITVPALPLPAIAEPLRVEIASRSLPQRGEAESRLPGGWFAAPAATPAAAGPAPAMLLLHGCGGLFDGRGRLASCDTDYAAWLNERGVHLLVTDSLTPRGKRELCTQRLEPRSLTQAQRSGDVLDALRWLASQPGVDGTRIGVPGWSHGAGAVLASTNLNHAEVGSAGVRPSLAVAYFPGCRTERARGYLPVAPLLPQLGADDDWTPPGPCRALAVETAKAIAAIAAASPGAAAGRVTAPEVVLHPGAVHGFDGTSAVMVRLDVPDGTVPGRGVHLGGQPEARRASRAALDAFLRRHWGLGGAAAEVAPAGPAAPVAPPVPAAPRP